MRDRGLEDDDGLQPRGQRAAGLVLLQAGRDEDGRVSARQHRPVEHRHAVSQAGQGPAFGLALRGRGQRQGRGTEIVPTVWRVVYPGRKGKNAPFKTP